MRIFHKVSAVSTFAGTLAIMSCSAGLPNPKDVRWEAPFRKTIANIYRSKDGRCDTVIFFAAKKDTFKVRSFELGFYDVERFVVNYEMTSGSYHNVAGILPGHIFIKFNVASGVYSSKEIYFFGLLFDGEFIDKVADSVDAVEFDGDRARYRDLNIDKGVTSFRFSFDRGVVSFVDGDGAAWFLEN